MFLIALVIGSTQALMRVHFAKRVRHLIAGESFGYYSVATKSAAVIAPAAVGLLSQYFGEIRYAFLVMILPILLAMFFWSRVNNNPITTKNKAHHPNLIPNQI